MVRHPDDGLGLLLVMATVIAPAAIADDIALVVVFADLQLWEHLPRSLQL